MSNYIFVEIANTDGIFSSFFEGAPSINNDGIVTWQALLDSGGSGIYTGSGISLSISTIAQTGLDFSSFGFPSINDSGQVTFYAEKGGHSGIYFYENPSLTTLVAYKNQSLTENEQFISFLPDTAINNLGQVAFLAGLTGNNSGLFVGNAEGITRIVDTSGEFADFLGTPWEGDVAPSINDQGDIVFWGLLDEKLPKGSPEYSQIPGADMPGNVRGIYLFSPDYGIKTVVDNKGEYLSFSGSPDINQDGNVTYIFRGDGLNNVGTPYRGINLYLDNEEQTKTLVDNDDHQGKDGYKNVDKFVRFGFVDINDNNTIAFVAQFDPIGPQNDPILGIFTVRPLVGASANIDKVIAVGDTIDTKTVTNLLFFNNEGLNNDGQIAFSVAFSDGSQGIYRADPSSSLSPFPQEDNGQFLNLIGGTSISDSLLSTVI